jgi:fibronectin-binding autotransporter adhesin
MSTLPPGAYSLGGITPISDYINAVIETRNPTTSDTDYELGQSWINKSANTYYVLTSFSTTSGLKTANWQTATSAGVSTLTGDTGGAISPSAGNINIVGNGGTVSVTGSGNTLTISTTSDGFPVSPYVVGPSGQAGYQTIQSAITAATASGGTVYIQPGTYTENLTLVNGVDLVGSSAYGINGLVTITGIHTPPTSGKTSLVNLNLVSATHIISSNSAGSATLAISTCSLNCTNGYTFNVPSWTGTLYIDNCNNIGTNDGGVNNTGGAVVAIVTTGFGNGTGNTMTLSGVTELTGVQDVGCPVNFVTGANFEINNCSFDRTVTFSNNSTGIVSNCYFSTGSTAAMTMSSSAAVKVSECVINSSNSPSITGAGAGTFTLTSTTFLSNNNISTSLTYGGGQLRGANQVTRYVVGTSPDCAYNTIQSALDALVATTLSGAVYIQPGTYTEDLVYNGQHLIEVIGLGHVVIIGSHGFNQTTETSHYNINFESSASAFNSIGIPLSIKSQICTNCKFTINGYIFNLPNNVAASTLSLINCTDELSTANNIINTAGGPGIVVKDCEFTASGTFTCVSFTELERCVFPQSVVFNAALCHAKNCSFEQPVTFLSGSEGDFYDCQFLAPASGSAITCNSGITLVEIYNSTVTCDNDPAIDGTGTMNISNIAFLGTNSNIANTVTLTSNVIKGGPFPTPFVVSGDGTGSYKTIQAAITAAAAAGGGMVYIRAGSYTESLTLSDNVDLIGSNYGDVIITGVHTPPASGSVLLDTLTLVSATHVLSSNAAGSTTLTVNNCITNVTNGFVFNLPNWTGALALTLTGNIGTNDGCVNNTGGSSVDIVVSEAGIGTGQTMVTRGVVTLKQATVGCPMNFQTGTNFSIFGSDIYRTLTLSNNSTGSIADSYFSTGATAAMTMSSSGSITISNSVITSSNNPAISGAGAGTLTLTGIDFTSNGNLAGTLTVAAGRIRGGNFLSQFIVGPAPDAQYQTVQSAITAAAAAGGGTVFVKPGTYTENLTLSDGVDLVGSSYGDVIITGVHTPPNTGSLLFDNLTLASATHIFSSNAAGSTTLTVNNCITNVTNGFVFNVANWTGGLALTLTGNIGTNDGCVNNTGGSSVDIVVSEAGAGTGQTMVTTGAVTLKQGTLACPATFQTGTNFSIFGSDIYRTLTLSNNSTGSIVDSYFSTGATAAITMSSSAAVSVSTSVITSSNNPAIAGAGAGTLTLTGVSFTSNAATAGTLTLAYGTTTTGTINAGSDINLTTVATKITLNGGAATDFIGTATLTSGTVTVSNTNIATTDRILVTRSAVNASTALGVFKVVKTAATNFIITACKPADATTETGDASTVDYIIFRQT